MENEFEKKAAYRLIPNENGNFEVFDCRYDITIACKNKEDQEEALKLIKKASSVDDIEKEKEELKKKMKKIQKCLKVMAAQKGVNVTGSVLETGKWQCAYNDLQVLLKEKEDE